MAEKKHILIVCGEPSGDLNAAALVKEIRTLSLDCRIQAVGGALLRQAGAEVFFDIKGLAVMGFFDVLKKLPQFLSLKKRILEKIIREKPDCVVLVDFSGFNLRLARSINNAVPVLYYISPQVWASREGRVKTINAYVRKLIVLFKFEEEFYARFGIKAICVGHPLLDIVEPSMNRKDFLKTYSLPESGNTIALLPGSRPQEIRFVLPAMLGAAALIQKKIKDARFIIAKSPNVPLDIYYRAVRKFPAETKIIENRTYDCLYAADFALVCSGTATLEAAILQTPFAVVYRMNPLNYFLYRPQVKLACIGMVNIVAGKCIVPEFVQFEATPAAIARQAIALLQDPAALEKMRQDLARIKPSLGEKGASKRAARIIIDFLNQPQ